MKMCKKHNPRKIDDCMKVMIKYVESLKFETLACCCGHGRYFPTLVVRRKGKGRYRKKLEPFDLLSNVVMKNKRKFYKKDKKGYYYIPEVEEYWKRTEFSFNTQNKLLA